MQIQNVVRMATFFQHAGIAMIIVFIPIMAKDITESFLEVGLIVASYSLAQILSELYFGRRSDASGHRMVFIRMGFIACAVVFGLHYFAVDALTLLLARIFAGVATGIMIPAFVAYSYELTGDGRKAATVVSFHALGWMVGILATGVVGDIGLAFLVSAAFFVAGFVLTLRLPEAGFGSGPVKGSIRRIITRNRYLFWAVLLRHIAATAVWTILPVILVEHMYAELYHISIIYVVNTFTAFIIMNMMVRRIQITDRRKIQLGLAGIIPAILGMSIIIEWWMAMPFMVLVGVSWAMLFVGGNFYLMERNPHSTSTGLFSSTISVATVIGPVIGGAIAAITDYQYVMYVSAAIAGGGLLSSIRIPTPPANTSNSCKRSNSPTHK